MKKMCLFFLTTCVILSFLMLTSTTKALDLEKVRFVDISPYERWTGLQFASNNVLIGSKGTKLYRIVIQDQGRDLNWFWKDVGDHIFDIAVPRENPFFVAYLKGDSIGMRYTTSGLGWRGGFGVSDVLAWYIAIADDGDHLVEVGLFDELRVWNVDDPSAEKKKKYEMNVVSNGVTDVAMGESGLILVADGQSTEVWFRNDGYQFRMNSGDNTRVEHLDHEAGYVASSCNEFIDIWRTGDGSYVRTLWLPGGSDAALVAFSLDSRYLAAAVDTNGPVEPYRLYVFDRGTGSRLEDLTMDEPPTALAFSPDDNLIVVGSAYGRLYFFNNRDVAGAPAAETEAPANPDQTILLANYPNPFNPETWIPYQLATPAEVTVSIHAADGTLVRRLALGQLPAGVYQDKDSAAYWDGKNEQGEAVASGVYFYTLKAGDFSATKKMLIRK